MMNCSECRDELLLRVGQAEPLPSGLRDHLNSCDECRKIYQELKVNCERLGNDTDFVPDGLTEEQFVAAVERRIERVRPSRVTWVAWRRYVPVVAAILIVFAITLLGYRELRIEHDNGVVQTADTLVSDGLLWTLYDQEINDFDDEFFNLILSDFVIDRYFDAGEQLLDDLSEEELQYLQENFNVGEIL